MGRMFYSSCRWLVLLCIALAARSAAGQPCHPPAAPPAEAGTRSGLVLAVQPESAVFRRAEGGGNYQGLAVSGGWSTRRFAGSLYLPAYRLETVDSVVYGPGDAAGDLAVRLVGGIGPAAGLGVSGSIPSGSATRALGMGHAMLMARVWATGTWLGIDTALRLGFGRALARIDSSAHHHHGSATGPIINPMNASEAEAGVGLAVPVRDRLRLTASLLGAVPVGLPGTNRAVVSVGADAAYVRWSWGLRLESTVIGAPQTFRLAASLGVPL